MLRWLKFYRLELATAGIITFGLYSWFSAESPPAPPPIPAIEPAQPTPEAAPPSAETEPPLQASSPEPDPLEWETLPPAREIILRPRLYADGLIYCGAAYLDRIEPPNVLIATLSNHPGGNRQNYLAILLPDGQPSLNLRFYAQFWFAGRYVGNSGYPTVLGGSRTLPVFRLLELSASPKPCGPPAPPTAAMEEQPSAIHPATKPCPIGDSKRMNGEDYARHRECETEKFLRKNHNR